jgi:hypothetical protein
VPGWDAGPLGRVHSAAQVTPWPLPSTLQPLPARHRVPAPLPGLYPKSAAASPRLPTIRSLPRGAGVQHPDRRDGVVAVPVLPRGRVGVEGEREPAAVGRPPHGDAGRLLPEVPFAIGLAAAMMPLFTVQVRSPAPVVRLQRVSDCGMGGTVRVVNASPSPSPPPRTPPSPSHPRHSRPSPRTAKGPAAASIVCFAANANLAISCYDNDGDAVAYRGALTGCVVTPAS